MKLISKKTYIEDRRWFAFYPKLQPNHTTISQSFYFDPRPHIHIQLTTIITLFLIPFLGIWSWLLLPCLFWGWGEMFIVLPFDSGINDSDWKEFGFHFGTVDHKWHIDHLVLETFKGNKYIYMPWALSWYRTSALRKDGEWEHEIGRHNKEFYDIERWKDILYYETHPYIYTDQHNEKQNALATIRVVEREWRRKLLPNSKLFNVVIKVIDIQFSDEIGERKGSYKGGTIGCSFEMLPNETPVECLKRMEQTRKFN